MIARGTHDRSPPVRLTTQQAQDLLADHLARYRRLSYQKLARRIGRSATDPNYPEVVHAQTPAGAEYAIKTIIVWDDAEQRNIRVMADLTAYPQVCLLGFIPIFVPDAVDSFILAPDGVFVGE